jgi:hypothetical protein
MTRLGLHIARTGMMISILMIYQNKFVSIHTLKKKLVNDNFLR